MRRMGMVRLVGFLIGGAILTGCLAEPAPTGDLLHDLQNEAIYSGRSNVGHWGMTPDNYTEWGTHSNRLIPVYTFGTLGAGPGVDLTNYTGANSPYRDEQKLRQIYGRLPSETLNPHAEYCDQTNLFDIQKAAAAAGKKHIFLVIFDGMDWQITQAAAIAKAGKVAYTEGRGMGFHFQDETAGGTTQFGWMCTSPHNAGTDVDVDQQLVKNPGGTMPGGYDGKVGGLTPWAVPSDIGYLISKPTRPSPLHAYTDSSCSASSMTAGIKSYNNAVNVDSTGSPVTTIAHLLQEQGWAVGAVSSVPISHATPAAAYAHNVSRDDYQDLTRDMLGLKSISHPEQPLSGMDVVIGGGFGDDSAKNSGGGKNYVPGNVYLTADDLKTVDVRNGGRYRVAIRTAGVSGASGLLKASEEAARDGQRLLGFYGVGAYKGHLPFQTADGDFRPALGRSKKAESYSSADIDENPTLAEMTQAALNVLSQRDRFWLMVEPGDVDWACHDNNLDNAAGAILSGDAAVKLIIDWVEKNSSWNESLLIVTADHGHYFHLREPELLFRKTAKSAAAR